MPPTTDNRRRLSLIRDRGTRLSLGLLRNEYATACNARESPPLRRRADTSNSCRVVVFNLSFILYRMSCVTCALTARPNSTALAIALMYTFSAAMRLPRVDLSRLFFHERVASDHALKHSRSQGVHDDAVVSTSLDSAFALCSDSQLSCSSF